MNESSAEKKNNVNTTLKKLLTAIITPKVTKTKWKKSDRIQKIRASVVVGTYFVQCRITR